MTSAAQFLLDECFWNYLDRNVPAEATPLLTNLWEGQSLPTVLQSRFGLTPQEAELQIRAARDEVEL